MMKNSRNSREGVHNKKGLLIVQEGRIEWMDAAKGYGILLVVFAHLGIGAIPTSYLNSFYMPLFFFLSGYVFSPKCEAKRFLHNKTKSILLPYFALGFPMLIFEVVVNCIIGKATFSFGIDLFVKFLIQRRLWTIWYLTCLFVAINFFYLIIRHLNSIVSGIVILLLFILTMIYYSVGGIELPWNIDVVPVAMLFLYDGYLFKNLQFSNKIDLLPMKKNIFLFVVCSILHIGLWMLNIRINGQGLELYYSKYGIPFLTIPSAIAGIVSVVILAHYIRPKLIQYFGQNTLVYFAWHHTIMIPIVRAVLSTLGVCTGYLTYDEHNKMLFIGERLLEFLIIIVILTIINIIISNTKLKFMIGR